MKNSSIFHYKKRVETAITVVFIVLYGSLLIYFASAVKDAVKESVNICLTVIIPSLYAFMVLSSFTVSTGIYSVLSRPFSGIARYVFRIPPELFSIFILSSLAGYPVGAKLLQTAVSEGRTDKNTAADMQNFCYMGGPAYFCGVVSITLFKSIKFGLIITLIVFLSNILSGIISSRKREIPPKTKTFAKVHISTSKFLSAVTDGGKSILIMCGIIVFFSTFNCLLEKLGFFVFLSRFLSMFFGFSHHDSETIFRSLAEITNVVRFTPGNIMIFPILTALLSFGGFCVILQVLHFSSGFIKTGAFFIHRLFTALTSFLLAKIALIMFPKLTAVLADTMNGGFTKGSVLPAILLIFMTVILLTFDVGHKRKVKRLI